MAELINAVNTSEAEEMYLITVARAIEEGHPEPVAASIIAKELKVSAVSVNQMIKKLAERGLVTYTPYRGVGLTDEGQRIAAWILRRRRLWGVFLCDRLGLPPHRADTIACDMEHITPDDVADLLAHYLDDPQVGPGGRAIPAGSPVPPTATEPLSAIAVGETRAVASIGAADAVHRFLANQGVKPGNEVTVLGIGDDGSCLLGVGDRSAHLASDVAGSVLVEAVR